MDDIWNFDRSYWYFWSFIMYLRYCIIQYPNMNMPAQARLPLACKV